ncbi:hypothetical protein HOE67_03165 [Candidatus Peregrinibacteria bacterium]|jgi:hypothetical protein|nr:hypothetical protein [Candidatus Peregrinibacteria bacterium]MBT4056086.1 hypothetical protein [Candidatus Peregrinibacteria bacterium]
MAELDKDNIEILRAYEALKVHPTTLAIRKRLKRGEHITIACPKHKPLIEEVETAINTEKGITEEMQNRLRTIEVCQACKLAIAAIHEEPSNLILK